jgi:hypothetical protein
VDVGEDRSRRAQAWIGVGALAVLVAGVAYLRPSLGPPAAASPPAAGLPLAPGGWRLGSVSFGDVDHGAVQFYGSGPGLSTTFLTSDGGRTWQPANRDRTGFALAGFLDRRTVLVQTATRAGPTNTRLSDDGGHTWRRLPDPRRFAGLGLPGFLDAQHGWWLE